MSDVVFKGRVERWYSNPRLAEVRLDRQCNDFRWLIGKTVDLDGVNYTVHRVLYSPHVAPFKVGELIGLGVK